MSAARNPNTSTIYVELLDEGTLVLRPAIGEIVSEDTYRLVATCDYDPTLESWKFKPGAVVACGWEEHNGERLLVAKSLVN